MSWGAVAVAGASLVGGALASSGAKKAGAAAQRGADAASAESSRQFDTVRADTAPLRSVQGSALDTLASLYGWAPPSQQASREAAMADRPVGDTMLPGDARLVSVDGGRNRYWHVYLGDTRIGTLRPGGQAGRFVNDTGVDIEPIIRAHRAQQAEQAAASTGAPGQPNMSAFFTSPDFQFNLDQGQRAIDRSAAARGGALSGRAVREGQRFASGLASGEYGNYVNRLLAAAGLGTTGVTTSAQAGMTTAGQIGAAQQNAAAMRGSAYMAGAQGLNNAVQGGISNLLLLRYLGGNTQPPLAPSTTMAHNYTGPIYGGLA